jgi:acyl carrier protein
MTRAEIRRLLIQILEDDLGQSHEDLNEAADLRTDLGLDSVDLVSVVSQVERRFKIRLTQEELAALATVKDVLDLLEGKFGEQSGAAA